MERSGRDVPVDAVVSLLDDIFGGRARLHLVDPTTRRLHSLGTDDPPLEAPGPLHDALETDQTVVGHVGASTPASWSASYRAWIPRGGYHLVAARVDGGGAVVGVLSVVRSESSRVPLVEDRQLVGALAMRLGRDAAVSLARAGEELARANGVRTADEAPLGARFESRAEPTVSEPSADAGPGVEVEADSDADPDVEVELPLQSRDFDDADLAVRAVSGALDLGDGMVEVVLSNRGPQLGQEVRTALSEVLGMLTPSLRENLPSHGLLAEVTRTGGSWRCAVRPSRLEEGWPRRPAVPGDVAAFAESIGASADVVADPETGWLVEVVMGSGPAEAPAQVSASLQGGIDLMAASLGDTASMVMLAVAADGRVMFCNDELAGRLGGTVADLLGRPLSSARGSSGSWTDFQQLFDRVDDEGVVQATLAWPHPESGNHLIRWTVCRSHGQEVGPVYLCFGVDAEAERLSPR